jgi:hypothetical protein
MPYEAAKAWLKSHDISQTFSMRNGKFWHLRDNQDYVELLFPKRN